jgi:hypothetical protein
VDGAFPWPEANVIAGARRDRSRSGVTGPIMIFSSRHQAHGAGAAVGHRHGRIAPACFGASGALQRIDISTFGRQADLLPMNSIGASSRSRRSRWCRFDRQRFEFARIASIATRSWPSLTGPRNRAYRNRGGSSPQISSWERSSSNCAERRYRSIL